MGLLVNSGHRTATDQRWQALRKKREVHLRKELMHSEGLKIDFPLSNKIEKEPIGAMRGEKDTDPKTTFYK
ncbi:hypothetical protein GCM10023188_19060 [Pontibacter saemangeumensis]|uniref:Uncharacterized protein n=1 Tax=Pontibacter saemangeumensis TaxID=1084525 RepID=A0ABP8LKR4_9BACT